MKPRDWWLGVIAVALAILFHAAFPRYEWRDAHGVPLIRIDRWTGRQELGGYVGGDWQKREPPAPTAGQGQDVELPAEYAAGRISLDDVASVQPAAKGAMKKSAVDELRDLVHEK
jgi:hypothetical protein